MADTPSIPPAPPMPPSDPVPPMGALPSPPKSATVNRRRAWRRCMWREGRKYRFYYLCQLATLCALARWIHYSRLPWPGVAIAILAVLAALMSVQANIRPRHKFIYFCLMALLLFTEFRAMRKDREVAQQEQNDWNTREDNRLVALLDGERLNTATLLGQENTNLSTFLNQDQREFVSTVTTLLDTHRQDERDFAGLLERQNRSFEEQQNLSEEFHGRLVPGDKPTPANACGIPPATGEVMVINGDSADVTKTFPHTILKVGGFPVLSVDRVNNSNDLSLSVDLRDQLNRIVFRMDKNGVVNRSNMIFLNPDKSTFLLQDEHGDDVFRATFINPTTFEVSGTVLYCGQSFPVQDPRFHGLCSRYNGGSEISYRAAACPTQQ